MKVVQHVALKLFLLVLLLTFAGCGGKKFVELSGAVSYEGQSVAKGRISFIPQDGMGATAAGIIADGKYSLQVPPGTYLVQIEGYKVLGQEPLHPGDPASPMVDKMEQMVPAEYNENSTLKHEVKSGMKVLDFHLKKS